MEKVQAKSVVDLLADPENDVLAQLVEYWPKWTGLMQAAVIHALQWSDDKGQSAFCCDPDKAEGQDLQDMLRWEFEPFPLVRYGELKQQGKVTILRMQSPLIQWYYSEVIAANTEGVREAPVTVCAILSEWLTPIRYSVLHCLLNTVTVQDTLEPWLTHWLELRGERMGFSSNPTTWN